MRRTLRIASGIVALVAPIGAGWAYTSGASVGEDGSGIIGLFTDDETIDEFLDEDGYLITRESYGGVVTMSVVDPDGLDVAIDDLPAEIADRVEYYEDDWSSSGSPFQDEDGATCYALGPDSGPGYGVVDDANGLVRALSVVADVDGAAIVTAKEWAPDTLSAEELQALQVSDMPIAETPGGVEIQPCNN